MAPPPPPRGRHLTARDALYVVGIVVFLLVILAGRSVRHAGKEMADGWEKTMVLAIGEPAGWVADKLPLQDLVADVTKPLKSGDDLGDGPGGFDDNAVSPTGVPPVTPDAFDARDLGEDETTPPRKLQTILVTGDSMALILDAELARRFTGSDVKVVRDPRPGTGLSISTLVDWGKLSVNQIGKNAPEAVVFFIGANDGYDLKYAGKSYKCCGPQWAAAYANRARTVMNNYRQDGEARVYWMLLPAPRDSDRQKVARAVNLAEKVAASAYGAQVRLLDMSEIFTPDFKYRDSMDIDGKETLVRQADGIHLNQAGNELAADAVVEALRADFGDQVPTG
ncbi:MAG: GDSL-type esterase/lipase family protein [Solirubrobacteraceae bacterium]